MLLLSIVLSLFACAEADCPTDSGVSHASGESWTCDDDCNTCSCEDGAILITMMACTTVTCTEDDGTVYDLGESWTCTDGCNTCTCESGGSISATEMSCDPA